ncbi:MAG: NAD(P)/FAD-dependent oxidoreductase [Nannocystaceae bacterium]
MHSAPEPQREVDVIVIGGGPAGLSAALCLGRARRSVVVLDRGGPRHAVSAGVHNFLTREGIAPAELRRIAWEQMRAYPSVRREEASVAAIERRGDRWIVGTKGGASWSAGDVLLATGVVDQHPSIPGYAALWGRSIFLCPYCHGWEVQDQALAVLGQGPGLAHLGPLLLGWSRDVVVCTDGVALDPEVQAGLVARGLEVRTSRIVALEGDGERLTAIVFDDGARLRRDAIFAALTPQLPPLVAGLGLDLDAMGFVRVDEMGATSRPGIWAAGDLTSFRHQVVEAAAQGLRAAAAINAHRVFGAAHR